MHLHYKRELDEIRFDVLKNRQKYFDEMHAIRDATTELDVIKRHKIIQKIRGPYNKHKRDLIKRFFKEKTY